MKHKTLKRVLCFLLALVVVASMPLDIHANAVAIELGWVTWALVSYLAASGFAFAVSGGIQALQSDVEQKVDEYYQVTGIDLYQLIVQTLRLKPSNNGNGNGFWFGATAVVAIAEFINWVKNNGWSLGSQNNNELRNIRLNASPEIQHPTILQTQVPLGRVYEIVSFGDIIPATNDDIYLPNVENHFYIYGTGGAIIADIFWKNISGKNVVVNWYVYDLEGNRVDAGNAYTTINDNFLGFTLCVFNDVNSYQNRVMLIGVSNNGTITNTNNSSFNLGQYGVFAEDSFSTSAIVSPSEITEFQPSQDEVVEIDFSVFENESTFSEPEELAEAVKQQIIDTGTTPEIITEVKTETQPEPTPQPTPVPTPPVYEDVDGLGLPSLAETMKNKFPFCLPYDLGRVFQIFYAEPVAPYWEVDLFATLGNRVPFVGDTSFTIDLAEYDELGVISRWMTTIGYVLLLILITRQTTKW